MKRYVISIDLPRELLSTADVNRASTFERVLAEERAKDLNTFGIVAIKPEGERSRQCLNFRAEPRGDEFVIAFDC